MEQKRRFPVWGWFFVFFGVVFTMDAIMVTLAQKTFNGVRVDNAYEKGLAHNETLARSKAQKDLGWTSDIQWQQANQRVTIQMADVTASPLSGANLSVEFFRPTHEGHDFKVDLFEKNDGFYESEQIDVPLKGQWEIRLIAERGGDLYAAKQRVIVK